MFPNDANGRALTGEAHAYTRRRTPTLFAARQVASGEVTARHYGRRRRIEFLDFMNRIVAAHEGREIRVVLDDLNTHKPKRDRWLARHINARRALNYISRNRSEHTTLPFIRRLRPQTPELTTRAGTARPNRYSSRWRRFSEHYRRRFPFCAECFRRDKRLVYEGVLVDHKYPVADGGPMLPGDDGVMTLCVPCHGAKTAMETYARDTGQMDQLIQWCDDPAARPAPFKTWRFG